MKDLNNERMGENNESRGVASFNNFVRTLTFLNSTLQDLFFPA